MKQPAALSLDTLRKRSEEYLEAVHREEYQFASGLKAETDLPDIEDAYADLASPKAVEVARQALQHQGGEEAQRTFHLLNFLLEQLMESQLAPARNRLYARQARATLKIQKKPLPFRHSQSALATEPDRLIRLLIGSEQHRVFARLNPLLLEILRRVHDISAKLNRGGHVELCSRRLGVNLKKLGEAAGRLLSDTREVYLEQIERAARERLKLSPDDLRREDMAFLLGDAEFEGQFPAGTMVSTAEKLQRELGLDPTAGGRIAYDIDERDGKSHRACTYPIRVPDEIVVAVRAKAGPAALRQLLQQIGEALHRAAIDPSLPFEYRRLGSPAVLQSTGHLLAHLALDPEWLGRHFGPRVDLDALRSHQALKELYFVRLLATQFQYELALHAEGTVEHKDVVFSDLILEHCSVRFAPEAYLFFTDFQFNTAVYLRGLLLGSLLRRRLVERFGPQWFTRREAGGFLRDLWKHGGKISYADALERLGGKDLDLAPLTEELRSLVP